MAKEREPRNKPKEHKDLNALSPFKYTDLGTPNDPCFGKLYNMKNAACKRCGDFEACAIVYSQKGFVKEMEKQNKKGAYLDIEEGQLTDKQDGEILEYLVKKFKADKELKLSIAKIATKFLEKFNLLESDQTYMEQRVIKVAESKKNLKVNKKLTRITHVKNN